MNTDELTAADQNMADTAWASLQSLLPLRELTRLAREGRLPPRYPIWPDGQTCPLEALLMGLSREKRRHVLVSGPPGVGRTTLVEALGERMASGQAVFLRGVPLLWIDVRNVGPEDSRACLESIFAAVHRSPHLVLCLDGLASILKRPQGTNLPLLRALLSRPGLRLLGVVTPWEAQELIAADATLTELFTRIELSEPTTEVATRIVQFQTERMSRQFGVQIPEPVVERGVTLASTFMLSSCHPAKGVRLFEEVCEEVAYRRVYGEPVSEELSAADVVRGIAARTGIPESAIGGATELPDFETALGDAVVGQRQAVQDVAAELRLIQAGLQEPGKPAAVFLFAGMTGVGKTELAKRIAEVYSSSRRLQVYSMGNFTEPHSVSGIIGVPPGYVGHDAGGRLVNELLADPYSVFLLDEAEKCHPNVWKPFLNLFDEGWIVDQRGVKASADRAIFILTTNAGGRDVEQMVQEGLSATEMSERIRQSLARFKQERSGQLVFPPQFLARIQRIIPFVPLDEPAMIGIAERACRKLSAQWRQKREKQVDVDADVLTDLGKEAHAANQRVNGEEGGRIVRKLVRDRVEGEIQAAAQRSSARYQATRRIWVSRPIGETEAGTVQVSFDSAEVGGHA